MYFGGVGAALLASGLLGGLADLDPAPVLTTLLVLAVLAVSLLNLALNWLWAPHAAWALLPIGLYSFGWALMTPVVTLLVLDLHPNRVDTVAVCQRLIDWGFELRDETLGFDHSDCLSSHSKLRGKS